MTSSGHNRGHGESVLCSEVSWHTGQSSAASPSCAEEPLPAPILPSGSAEFLGGYSSRRGLGFLDPEQQGALSDQRKPEHHFYSVQQKWQ